MVGITTGLRRAGTEQQVENTSKVGHSLEELKFEVGKAILPELAPVQSVESKKLIGGASHPEFLRLGAFPSFPTGVRQEQMLRRVLARRQSPETKQLLQALQASSPALLETTKSHLKASFAREHNMLELVASVAGETEQISGRRTATQEG